MKINAQIEFEKQPSENCQGSHAHCLIIKAMMHRVRPLEKVPSGLGFVIFKTAATLK